MIDRIMPEYGRATALAEAYLKNLSWFFQPVGREQIMEELMPAIYKERRENSETNDGTSSPDSQEHVDPHDLALLLAVFSLGAVSDLTLTPTNDEGELYYHCCLAALSLKSMFEYPSLASIQAISIIANYGLFACRSSTLGGSYKIMNLACSLALQVSQST